MWALSFSIDLNPYDDNINDINNTVMTLRLIIEDDIDKAIKNYRLLDNINSTDCSKQPPTDKTETIKTNSLYEDLNRIGRNNNITYSNNKWHWFTTGLSIVFVLGLFAMAGIVMYRVHRQKGRGNINNVMNKFSNKLEYIYSGRVAPSEQDSQCIELEPVLSASAVEERHGPLSQPQP